MSELGERLRAYRASLPATPAKSPGRSRVVRILQPNGATVVKGDPLLEIADCDRLFVYAIVSQDHYRRLAPGAAARVEVGGKRYDGKVVALFGPYGKSSAGMAPEPPVVVEPTPLIEANRFLQQIVPFLSFASQSIGTARLIQTTVNNPGGN